MNELPETEELSRQAKTEIQQRTWYKATWTIEQRTGYKTTWTIEQRTGYKATWTIEQRTGYKTTETIQQRTGYKATWTIEQRTGYKTTETIQQRKEKQDYIGKHSSLIFLIYNKSLKESLQDNCPIWLWHEIVFYFWYL